MSDKEENNIESVHVPVMLTEALEGAHLQKGMTVIDATLGGGSYTRALHQIVMPGGRVIAIDRDRSAIERFRAQYPDLADDITLVHDNYAHVQEICTAHAIDAPDAIIADLGISSDQLERADRGFSFLSDGPIDMRMDTSVGHPAADIVNKMSEHDLSRLLRMYGDEQHAKRVARAIIAARPLMTTGDLSQVIAQALGNVYAHKHIHPATKTFQALRIAVNNEYTHIERFIADGIALLKPGGYMSIVSFHSGEDRIVKNMFRTYAQNCSCPEEAPVCVCSGKAMVRLVSRQGCVPAEQEREANPRSRSARLRIVQKNNGEHSVHRGK